ncbi:DUF5047 domain-containing protein [Hamadaea sp. NPDC051192]|uniref:DUF5047 domain-containing protein n=1 Tax=Hamadaea sp. NPDC051192 TaxID=3154940 RepID=UPI003445C5A0
MPPASANPDSSASPLPDMYTVPEAAKILGCSPKTVYGAIKSGSLRAVNIGRCKRLTGPALADFVNNGGTQPAPPRSVSFDDSAVQKRSCTVVVPARTPLLRLDPGNDPMHPLNNYGQRLRIRTGLRIPGGEAELLDMGWYLITTWSRDEQDGTVTIRGADLSKLIVDARLYAAESPPVGATYGTEFVRLVDGILPAAVSPDLDDMAISSGTVWERDRDAALTALTSAWNGARWYVDDSGTVEAAPAHPDITSATTPDVVITDGSAGTLTGRQRDADRDRQYNALVVTGATPDDGTAAPYAVAEITDPASPIRVSGPFGRKPRFFQSDLITTGAQATATATNLLGRYTLFGRAEAVDAVPDPRVQLGDVARIYTADGDAYLGRITALTLPLTGAQGAMNATASTLPRDDEGS